MFQACLRDAIKMGAAIYRSVENAEGVFGDPYRIKTSWLWNRFTRKYCLGVGTPNSHEATTSIAPIACSRARLKKVGGIRPPTFR